MIGVIFKNNSKYRVLSNLYLQYVQKIMHREDVVLDQSGEIDADKYLNYYEQILDYDIKESFWVDFCISRAQLAILIFLMQ